MNPSRINASCITPKSIICCAARCISPIRRVLSAAWITCSGVPASSREAFSGVMSRLHSAHDASASGLDNSHCCTHAPCMCCPQHGMHASERIAYGMSQQQIAHMAIPLRCCFCN